MNNAYFRIIIADIDGALMENDNKSSNAFGTVKSKEWTDKKKRGLVLAGGGAKGAYTFGCLEAFKELEIEFDAVAGTSVGALNAFLWSADAMKKGKAIWQNLSFESVYPVRILNPKYFHKHIIRMVSFLYVFLRLMWEIAKGSPTMREHQRPLKFTFIILVSIPILLSNVAAHALLPDIPLNLSNIIFLALVFPITPIVLELIGSKDAVYFIYGPGLILLCILFFYPILDHFVHLDQFFSRSVYHEYLLQPIFWVLFFILLAMIFFLTAMLVFKGFIFSQKFSVLDATPLKSHLRDVLTASELKVPIWATVASKASIFDPVKPTWHIPSNDRGITSPDAICTPYRVEKWCSEYIRLDILTKDEIVNFCAASAALPFGIIPPFKQENIHYVDGGVADNCPLVPLMQIAEFDEIYIVLLESYKNDDEAFEREKLSLGHCRERQRTQYLKDYPLPETKRFSDHVNYEPVIIPYELTDYAERLVFFYPKQSLGGFLSGTLNFTPKYASALMNLGKKDALAKLQSLTISSIAE
ncbi:MULTISPECIES: patatin-like phospholipase family protein [unclassified Pedobacter]|uniref:patatin-like phospholipase family protein n=1 Tax=unclassified Pedobacter TaxID=2628915 RepID=UPI0014225DEA|nr:MULTISPECIES: patatin-like phospholipase family protein [unclassified Pedobacter]NII83683.1 hypothetical protein [Pedobacter sp. SG908]NMN37543.1 hypothetical protein [Pedobacter sp. SG918]